MWFSVNILSILLYALAASSQYAALVRPARAAQWLLLGCGVAAVLLHGAALYHWIDIEHGQNLSTMNLFSMVTWLVAILTLGVTLRQPSGSLGLIIFPLAGFSIVLAMLAPGHHVIDTSADPRQLIHILLSVLTFSVLVMAALQAVLLSFQQHRLRDKNGNGFLYKLPPLETMESMLFQLIMLGFLLLTVLLTSSFYFYHEQLWQGFLQKSLFATGAWVMFAVLLVGRQLLGWRGKKAVYCTLSGIGLLVLTYISSSFIIGCVS